MSVLRSHNNKTRGGLGLVCATGMYRSIEHVRLYERKIGTLKSGRLIEDVGLIQDGYIRVRLYIKLALNSESNNLT